jgi:hypothetical protein
MLARSPASSTVGVFSSPLTENVWQHVAIVQDAGQHRVYVGGQLESEGAAQTYSGPAALFCHIGFHIDPVGGDIFGEFVIDEVRISSTARYAANFVPAVVHTVDADTLSLWHFDESMGDQTVDAAGNEPDGILVPPEQRVVADR